MPKRPQGITTASRCAIVLKKAILTPGHRAVQRVVAINDLFKLLLSAVYYKHLVALNQQLTRIVHTFCTNTLG